MSNAWQQLPRAVRRLHHVRLVANGIYRHQFVPTRPFPIHSIFPSISVKQQIRHYAEIPGPLGKSIPPTPPAPPPEDHVNQQAEDDPDNSLAATKILPEFSLTDKVIVVSGGARGLGLVQSEALLEAGATVYALDRLAEPTADFYRIQKRARQELGTALHYRQIDVRDIEDLNSVIEAIADQHERLDGLIAAAGVQQETSALDYTADDANMMLSINVTGVLMTAQAVAKQMLRFPLQGESEIGKKGSRGSIVLIASMSGTVANRGLICPVYNASKGAVCQLARNLAMEWGEHGIRVNTISPGYIVTDMVTMLFETQPEREELWASHNMLGRLSSPREFRGAAVFLLSDASSFMTGSDLKIDGGHCAW